jgi:hypothetical protein
MNAVILAVSLGNRMGEAADTRLKPMSGLGGGINREASVWSSWTC